VVGVMTQPDRRIDLPGAVLRWRHHP